MNNCDSSNRIPKVLLQQEQQQNLKFGILDVFPKGNANFQTKMVREESISLF